MTPAQQAALEVLVERPLTDLEIELAAARNDFYLAASLSVGLTKKVNVPIADLQAYLQGNGLWWGIKAIAGDPANQANVAAQGLIDVASARYDNIDMSLPIVAQMLGALVAASAMPQTSMDALIAMSSVENTIAVQQISEILNGV